MKNVSIIYYSSTGNTEMMAKYISEGIKSAGGNAEIISVENASLENIENSDVIALGCPAMGAEQLDSSMENFIDSIKDNLSEKPLALFGSYDWGDGEWMTEWYELMDSYNANMIQDEGLICNLEPGDEDIENCKSLGKYIVNF
ncbi:flavodoxin [Gottschalkia purinilytica]|uniref:Flavodoxin n=1 Tax=Gottschalkia purinilytica TaxID=1503 RepID=A0A0L0W6D7_GOTPU|nr:flavodoxin [Gottschalkia purinilytica]KNF07084.1 flavodoxin [Gottschalkia purinilytica]